MGRPLGPQVHWPRKLPRRVNRSAPRGNVATLLPQTKGSRRNGPAQSSINEELFDVDAGDSILSEASVVATSLWVPHSYCYDLFDYTPRLFAHSPTRRCGKTTYLKLLQKMV